MAREQLSIFEMLSKQKRVESAKKLGKPDTHKYINLECPYCGKERWIPLTKAKKYNHFIPCLSCATKHRKPRKTKYNWLDLEKLYRLDGLSMTQIATIKGCDPSTVKHALVSRQIPPRSRAEGMRLLWYKRKGTVGGSYIRVKLDPQSPFYCMATKRGYILEHRLVVAKDIGRPLLPSEKVHHRDGIKFHNHKENLKLVSAADHRIYTELCQQCPLRKEIRLLQWHIKELYAQLQGRLLPDGDGDHA